MSGIVLVLEETINFFSVAVLSFVSVMLYYVLDAQLFFSSPAHNTQKSFSLSIQRLVFFGTEKLWIPVSDVTDSLGAGDLLGHSVTPSV